MKKAYQWFLTWAGTLAALAFALLTVEYFILLEFFPEISRAALQNTSASFMLRYLAQNAVADFIFLVVTAGAVAATITLGRKVLKREFARRAAWVLAMAGVALGYVLVFTPINAALITHFLTAKSIVFNVGLFLFSVAATYPIYRVARFYLRRGARSGVARVIQAVASTALLFSLVFLFAPRINAASASAPTSSTRPNVLIIVIDALRADALSCYGAPLPTPNIDGFAADSYVFENAFSCAPQTNLSVMSLYTSQYPTVHKARLDTVAAPYWKTLAETLSQNGYYCRAIIGNGILRPILGYDRGFDDYYLFHYAELLGGFELTPFAEFYRRGYEILGNRGNVTATTEWITGETVRFLEGYDGSRPFFLYVHYMDPHMPYTPPAKYVKAAPLLKEKALEKLATDADFVDTYEETDPEVLRALYLGEVSYVDDRMGEVLTALAKYKFYGNTFVIITADHGEEFREHGGLGHHTYYREVIRVPLIIKAPRGPFGKKGRYGGAVSLADLAPTVYAFLGIRPPAGLEGRDLASFVAGPAEDRLVYSEGDERADEPKAFHSSRYTVIEDRDVGSIEIYDRADDPGEQRNLYPLEARLSERLLKKLRSKCAAVDVKAARAGDAERVVLAEDEKSKLRALGYLED